MNSLSLPYPELSTAFIAQPCPSYVIPSQHITQHPGVTYLYNHLPYTNVENKRMDTKGGKPRGGGDGGVLNWATGIDMYTLMCIKLMTNKNLQYKQTNKQNKTKNNYLPY